MLFFYLRNVCKYINQAQKQLQISQKNTILCQLLEKMEKYNLNQDDVISIMTDLIIGGVDTVIFVENSLIICRF